MFDNLEILGMAYGLASHAATRQTTIARNIAHADTPGYKARDVASFSETYRGGSDGAEMRATRARHLSAPAWGNGDLPEQIVGGPSSPNGNSVSLENEMMKASEVRIQYDMALSIYSKSLNILRTSLGRGR